MISYSGMKSFIQFTVVVLLVASPAIISAFSPARTPWSSHVASTSINLARLNHVKMAGKSAKSKEEDLELTRAAIMQHISSEIDEVVVVAEKNDDEPSDTEDVDSEAGKGKRAAIKSFGSKMKKKIQNKSD
mmetsp:Transcript_20109/g.36148  ORF Transcript_20109/g.36148 Transcript_20109/m.36148 type:complete len:131 (+) Transcript_20109:214-606(+)